MRVSARYAVAALLISGCASEPTGPSSSSSWTHHDSALRPTTILDAIHGNDTYVIVGLHGAVATSPDAQTWTRQDGGFGATMITGLTFSDEYDRFIVGTSGDLGRTIATTTDGRVWTQHQTPRPEPMREVMCAGQVCVAVGDEGAMLRSEDLITWEDVSFTGGGFRWISVIRARGEFVATGGREQVARSVDGRSWTLTSLGITENMDPGCIPPTPTCNDIDDIAYTGGRFVAVTHPAPGVWVSDDLESWEWRDTGLPVLPVEQRGLWSILSARGITLVGGGGGKLAASYDHGETWEALDAGFGPTDDIWAMTHREGLFVVAGRNGTLATTQVWR